MGEKVDKYTAAGVNIDNARSAVERIKQHARSTFGPQVASDLGLFGGIFRFSGYTEPFLVSSVDGVGTKLKIAIALDKHNTIGIDLVNHCVNDILTCGAEPLFFLDYISVGKLYPEQIESIVSGLAFACRESGVALIGGETAEMPSLYAPGDYDLAGFIVGAVEKDRVINGTSIAEGDVIMGLQSSGLHTNGYSLVRTVFGDNLASLNTFYAEIGRTLGEELLEPHRCYYKPIKPALPYVKGMAHITGGGLIDNVPRILPEGLAAYFRAGSWNISPVFNLIQEKGDIDNREMYRVFNMGLGMVLICSRDTTEIIREALPEAMVVGEIISSNNEKVIIR